VTIAAENGGGGGIDTLSNVVNRGNTTSNTIEFDTDGSVYYAGNVVVLSGLDDHTIGIGKEAGQTDQGALAIAIGAQAGQSTQSSNAIAVGYQAGQTSQRSQSVAIGQGAGNDYQESQSVAVGASAGRTSQGSQSVAIGLVAGQINQGRHTLAIGAFAGQCNQQSDSVSIGYETNNGSTGQGSQSVALGRPENGYQSGESVAAGYVNARAGGGARSIAIGHQSKRYGGQDDGIAIGTFAGQRGPWGPWGGGTVIGHAAGRNSQANASHAVVLGFQAGQSYYESGVICLGYQAGYSYQNTLSIAIGAAAGRNTQYSRSVIVNATGGHYDGETSDALYIKPIRSAAASNLLYYNEGSGEITETAIGKVVAAGVVNSDGSADKEFGANTEKLTDGDYTITFDTTFGSADDYSVNLTAIEDGAARDFKVYVKDGSRTVGSVNVLTVDDSIDTRTDHPFCYSIIKI